MKASNQGFVDLHTSGGFFLIGTCFVLFTILIAVGSIVFKRIAAAEKEERKKLKAKVK